ncbi:hypothetical protein AAMO2058_001318600 [Amorphochlora amoebiformis]
MPRGKGLSDEVKTIIDSSYKVFKDESDPWKKIFNCYLKAYPDVTLKQVSDYGCKNIGKGRRKKRAASASADKVDVEEAIEVLSDVSPPRRKKRKSGNLEADVIEVEDYKTQQRRAHDSFLKTILDLVGKGPPPIFYRANKECLSKPGTIDGLTVAIARADADHTQVNVKVYHEIKCVHVQVKYFTMSLNDMEDVARRNLNMARRLNEIRKFNNPEKTTFEYAIKIPDEYVTHGHEICAEPTIRFICIFFPKQMDKSYGCSKGEFDGELSMDKGRSKPQQAQQRGSVGLSVRITAILIPPLCHRNERIDSFLQVLAAGECLSFDAQTEVDIYSLRFSPDASQLCATCADGSIRIVDPTINTIAKNIQTNKDNNPATCVRYRPFIGGTTKKSVIIVSTGDGKIQHWHTASRRKLFEIEEKENEINIIDVSQEGKYFASAGKDKAVRVYEENTKSLLTTLERGLGKRSSDGHSGRIFGLKFHPRDSNMVLSAGWDDTVHVWDIRAGMSVRMWEGAHICGDSLDIFEDAVLTGSWREKKGLQIWDLGTGKLVKDVDFHYRDKKDKETDFIYSAQFNHDGTLVAAGGSFANETRLFEVRKGFRRLDKMKTKAKGVYAVCFAPGGSMVASGSQGGHLSIMETTADDDDDY